MVRLMDGAMVADRCLNAVSEQVVRRIDAGLSQPCLAVVLVGDDAASAVYVRNKERACARVGIRSEAYRLPENTSQEELSALIARLNADASVHGILVQLPLPAHLDEAAVTEQILPQKDVDGFHPYNVGHLAMRRPLLRPCTPKGVMTLLSAYDVKLEGKKAVVVGASNIVGRPAALELLAARATVTVCHSRTQRLSEEVAAADILVVGVGIPKMIRGDWIKPGAVVVDVGINRLPDGTLCGDVDFDEAKQRASLITPVPGGVGRMTIASLMENTLQAAALQD